MLGNRFSASRFASGRLAGGLSAGFRIGESVTTFAAINQLSVPSVTDTTAQPSVSASPNGATVYLFVSTSSTPPDAGDLIAGTGAEWADNYVLPASIPALSGLTAETGYWVHALVDDGETRSDIVSVGFATDAEPLDPPVAAGGLADQTYTLDSGDQTVDAAADFTGAVEGTWSVTGGGATIDQSGVVTIPTTALLAAAVITVTYTNSGGSADSAFQVTVEEAVEGANIASLVATATGATTAQVAIDAGPVGASFYLYVSTSATPPSQSDLLTGTGAIWWSSAREISDTPTIQPGPSGLAAETTYWVHAIVRLIGAGGPEYSDVVSDSFTTEAIDVTAPVLSALGATVLDTTSAEIEVTTDEDRGTLYWFVSTSATPPSAGDLKEGTGSVKAGTLTVNPGETDLGIVVPDLTEVAHYGYFLQSDPSGNESAIAATGSFTPADVTAPVVSSVELVATTTATLTFNTDTAEGVAYFIVQPAADAAPSLAQIKAGSVGTVKGQKDVSTPGPQSVNITGLIGGVGYLAYVVHTDVAGNDSDVEVAPAEATPDEDIGESFVVTGGEEQLTIISTVTVAAPVATGGEEQITISS